MRRHRGQPKPFYHTIYTPIHLTHDSPTEHCPKWLWLRPIMCAGTQSLLALLIGTRCCARRPDPASERPWSDWRTDWHTSCSESQGDLGLSLDHAACTRVSFGLNGQGHMFVALVHVPVWVWQPWTRLKSMCKLGGCH